MSSEHKPVTPLDLSRWRKVPTLLLVGGGVVAAIGAAVNLREFGYAWLTAFMFFLSLCLGGLFLFGIVMLAFLPETKGQDLPE